MASNTVYSSLAAATGGGAAYTDRLPVRKGGRMAYVHVEEVDWIEARRNYVFVHRGGESFSLRRTMSSLEAGLDPNKFIRIHRSTIVNVDRIKTLRPLLHGHGIVELHNGFTLPWSRGYQQKISPQMKRMAQPGMAIQ